MNDFRPVDSRLAETWPLDYQTLLDRLAEEQAREEFFGPSRGR